MRLERGQLWRNPETGEVIKLLDSEQITLVTWTTESSWGRHRQRTTYTGRSSLRGWEQVGDWDGSPVSIGAVAEDREAGGG